MFERHTADNLVELITRILDVLCSNWREKLIGLGSDGENKMTGQHAGVVTQIERQAQHRVYRTWCALHQLDLVMQYGYKDLMDGKFLKYTTDFISHLRQQYSLIAEMQSTCPKLANRWIIMGTVCRWFLEHRDRLLQFIQDPDCSELTRKITPPAWWWIAVAAVAGITETVNVVFIKLQGKDITVEQQSESLEELSIFLCTQVGVRGPYDRNQLRVLNPMRFSICGRWALEATQLEEFLHGQSTFVLSALTALRQDDRVMLLASIGNMIVSCIDGILDIKAERNARNEPGEDIPPVLPHRLVKLRGKEFMNIISQHYTRLEKYWGAAAINKLEKEFHQLLASYHTDSHLKSALSNCDQYTTFESGWRIVNSGGQYNFLKDFCGGIATVFPNTATVEADFSWLSWNKDEFRKSLTDLSLEGIMQCKQFSVLSGLM